MKNILVVFVIILIIIGVFLSLGTSNEMVVVKEDNIKQLPLKIKKGHYQDSDCGMIIDDLRFVSQVVSPKGNTYFFHDHGGMAKWLKDKSFSKNAKIWVKSLDSKKYIDGRKAYYSRDDKTPMGYGFGAYEFKKDGYIKFDEMQLKMLRGETMNNPIIRKKLKGRD
ncbi:MAG: hypothetical protein OQJ77_07250 [Thiovulaceae bacterium]|nr:hypothetical protein [Sulfurimonadaceae bacterium]